MNGQAVVCLFSSTHQEGWGKSGRLGREDGGTGFAAAGAEGDFGEAFGAGGGGDRGGCFSARDKVLYREDHEEVDGGGVDEETDGRVEELAYVDFAGGNVVGGEGVGRDDGVEDRAVEDEGGEVGDAYEAGEEGGEDVAGEGGGDGTEGGTDEDGYGEVDYIAAEDEVAKAFEHFEPPGGWFVRMGEYIAAGGMGNDERRGR